MASENFYNSGSPDPKLDNPFQSQTQSHSQFKILPPPLTNATGSLKQPRGRRTRQPIPFPLSPDAKPLTQLKESEFHSKAYQLFSSLSPINGQIEASKLVPLFKRSGLPTITLGEIWQMADRQSQGGLDEASFQMALKLIILAQSGSPLNLAAINEVSDDLFPDLSGPVQPTPPNSQPSLIQKDGSTIWAISPGNKEKFAATFYDLDPDDEFLDGNKSKQSFLNTGVEVEKLAKIWSLVDPQGRGKLLLAEFLVAMHLIELVKSNTISALPMRVPFELAKSASEAVSDVLPQADAFPVSSSRSISTNQWNISLDQKSSIDDAFRSLPKNPDGGIPSGDCVQYFLSLELPRALLAQIWELASYRGLGELNYTEFLIAMTLIQSSLIGESLPGQLPETLFNFAQSQPQPEETQDLADSFPMPVIPEPSFDLNSLNIQQPDSTPDTIQLPRFDNDDYSSSAVQQLTSQLLDLSGQLDSDQMVVKELEAKVLTEQSELNRDVAQIQDLLKQRHNVQVQYAQIDRQQKIVAAKTEESLTKSSKAQEKVAQIQVEQEKLAKSSHIELGFLDYNLESALQSHIQLNELLTQLNLPQEPLPPFLIPEQ